MTTKRITKEEPSSYANLLNNIDKFQDIFDFKKFSSFGIEEIRKRYYNPITVECVAFSWIRESINDENLCTHINSLKEKDLQVKTLKFLTILFESVQNYQAIIFEKILLVEFGCAQVENLEKIQIKTLKKLTQLKSSDYKIENTIQALVIFKKDAILSKFIKLVNRRHDLKMNIFPSFIEFQKFPETKRAFFYLVERNADKSLEFIRYFRLDEKFCDEFVVELKIDRLLEVTSMHNGKCGDERNYLLHLDSKVIYPVTNWNFFSSDFYSAIITFARYRLPKLHITIIKFLSDNKKDFSELPNYRQHYIINTIYDIENLPSHKFPKLVESLRNDFGVKLFTMITFALFNNCLFPFIIDQLKFHDFEKTGTEILTFEANSKEYRALLGIVRCENLDNLLRNVFEVGRINVRKIDQNTLTFLFEDDEFITHVTKSDRLQQAFFFRDLTDRLDISKKIKSDIIIDLIKIYLEKLETYVVVTWNTLALFFNSAWAVIWLFDFVPVDLMIALIKICRPSSAAKVILFLKIQSKAEWRQNVLTMPNFLEYGWNSFFEEENIVPTQKNILEHFIRFAKLNHDHLAEMIQVFTKAIGQWGSPRYTCGNLLSCEILEKIKEMSNIEFIKKIIDLFDPESVPELCFALLKKWLSESASSGEPME